LLPLLADKDCPPYGFHAFFTTLVWQGAVSPGAMPLQHSLAWGQLAHIVPLRRFWRRRLKAEKTATAVIIDRAIREATLCEIQFIIVFIG
jgi:hypothetical protein